MDSRCRPFVIALRTGTGDPTDPLSCYAIRSCTRILIGVLLFQLFIRYGIPAHNKLARMLVPLDHRIMIDSGAGKHFCHDRSKFFNYRPFHAPWPVLGAGSAVWILGSGELELTTIIRDEEDDGAVRYETLHLHGVLHAPKSGVTVLSTAQLRQQGIFYSSETAVLYRKRGGGDEVVVVGETHAGPGCPQLKTVEEEEEGNPSPSSPRRRTWYDVYQDFYFASWSSWWTRFAGPTPAEATVRVSELEVENDGLVCANDSLKQEIAMLRRLQSDLTNVNQGRGL